MSASNRQWATASALLAPLRCVQAHEVRESLHRAIPPIVELEALASDKMADRFGQKYLTGSGLRRDARRQDHGRAEEIARLLDRLTGVETDPDRNGFRDPRCSQR